MASWFLGLPVAAGEWLGRLPAPPGDVALVHPEDLHLTIAFLGPVGEQAAGEAWAALRWDLPALPVTLGPVVPMGSARRPSAYSALVGEHRAVLEAAMMATRDACCDAARAHRDERAAVAHLTLARPSRAADDRARALGAAWAAALDLSGVELLLDRVALFGRAEGRGAGARYRIARERRLPAGPDLATTSQ